MTPEEIAELNKLLDDLVRAVRGGDEAAIETARAAVLAAVAEYMRVLAWVLR